MSNIQCSLKILLDLLITQVEHLFAQVNGGSTNINRVVYHVYIYPLNTYIKYDIYFMVEDQNNLNYNVSGN